MEINDKSPLISVIVPVYNAEPFLPECLDSILGQGVDNWEVIIVDDGSTDGSSAICDAYARKDPRFKVFHKENGGVSSARNYGLEKARGAWITYIDADDRISADYFPSALANSKADMVLTNVKTFPGKVDFGWISPGFVDKEHYKSFIEEHAIKGVLVAPWGKFVRREIIVGNNLSFNPKFRMGEDTLFDLQLESLCTAIEVRDSYYWYRYESHENWISRFRYTLQESLDYLRLFVEYYDSVGINSPDLIRIIYGNTEMATDFTGMSKFRWNRQPEVVAMKKRMLQLVGRRGKMEHMFFSFLSRLRMNRSGA